MSGAPRPDASRPLHQVEFVALMAMLAGTVAFSIDAMLPALGAIAAELSPQAMNRAQLVVTSFVFGMAAELSGLRAAAEDDGDDLPGARYYGDS